MKTILFTFLLLASCFAEHHILWIVGEDYVGVWDYQAEAKFEKVHPTSWSLNSARCELWITTEKKKTLSYHSNLNQTHQLLAERLLNESFEKNLYVRSTDGNLERWDMETRSSTTGPAIPATSFRIVEGNNRLFLTDYDFDHNKLNLQTYSPSLALEYQEIVSQNAQLWAPPHSLWDSKRETYWLGYSAQTPRHIYSPIVEQRDETGKLKQNHVWPDKGLFFDFCLEPDSTLLTVHDLPSPGFTVPLYSFIENLSPQMKVTPVYNVELNYFVDSLICEKDRLVMLQRSILGSDGSHIQIWNRKEPGLGEKVLKLPGQAKKIYSCQIPTTISKTPNEF